MLILILIKNVNIKNLSGQCTGNILLNQIVIIVEIWNIFVPILCER